MNDAQPVPSATERRAIFEQVRFQHVISDRWSAEDAEKVCGYTMLSLSCRLIVRVPDLKISQGKWRAGG